MNVTEAQLFEMIAETSRKYAALMAAADQTVSWDRDRQFVVVIARGAAAESLLDHLEPKEST